VGVFEAARAHETELRLEPGHALLLYTDGVTEGRGATTAFYGEARLLEVAGARTGDASDLAQAVVEDVLDFQGGSARDDIAVVVVRAPEPAQRV
jgi:sigma-B regulation protein RsbU (phosphoserine phosphatase)